MKILLVGSFEYPMYAPAFESAFRRLGHEVKSIRLENYNYGRTRIGRLLTRIHNRYHLGSKITSLNRDIIGQATEFRPDFVFLYRCYNVKRSTVRHLRQEGFFVITYNNDDPFSNVPSKAYYRFFLQTIQESDLNFVYRKKNIVEYEAAGARNTRLLLPYYIEKNNYRIDCHDDIPVAFLGHFENDGRDRFLVALKDAGVPITLFGSGKYWNEAPMLTQLKEVMRPGQYGEAYNHTINRLQIALVFLSKINHDTYTRRCFEIPVTATLMLCEYTDDMNEMFPEDECACYFRNERELVEKCRYLLSHPSEIRRIAENGYQRVKELGGSELDRCRQIISIYKEIKR